MKLFLLSTYTMVTFLLCSLFVGCKKSVTTTAAEGDSYMRYKLNGIKKDYNGCYVQFLDPVNGIYGAGIAGANTNDPSNDFSINLFSKTMAGQGSVFTANLVPGTYYTQAVLAYVQGSKSYASSSTLINPSAMVIVKITESGSAYVKGTFSGTLYDDAGTSSTIAYTVTEGEFKAKRN